MRSSVILAALVVGVVNVVNAAVVVKREIDENAPAESDQENSDRCH